MRALGIIVLSWLVAVALFHLGAEVACGEPMVATAPRTMRQAVEAGDAEIHVTTGGPLDKPLVIRTPGQTVIIETKEPIVCSWGVDGNCIEILADNVSIKGGTIRGVWTGDPKAPVAYRAGMHVVAAYGAQVFILSGVTIEGGHGDGIYLGPKSNTDRTPAVGLVDKCTVTGAYRNGISVTSATAKVSGCTIAKTLGVSPQAGIDVEPSDKADTIDVWIDGCTATGNRGSPYLVALDKITLASPPPRIRMSGLLTASVPDDQPTALRIKAVFNADGFPDARMPVGTLITLDGLELANRKK